MGGGEEGGKGGGGGTNERTNEQMEEEGNVYVCIHVTHAHAQMYTTTLPRFSLSTRGVAIELVGPGYAGVSDERKGGCAVTGDMNGGRDAGTCGRGRERH